MMLLRQRNFALVWWAGLISLTGDRAVLNALPFFVYLQTGSTLATAAMYAASYLPMVLLGSVAGVFVDRWDRQKVMVIASVLQAVAILPLLLVRDGSWLWLVYVVFFLERCLAMFFQPAESALLPQLVAPEQLMGANALNALNNNIARLIGPPIGGILLAMFGLHVVAILDGVSFLLAAGLLRLVSVAPSASPAEHHAQLSQSAWSAFVGVWREWADGMRFIRENRVVLLLLIVVGVTSFGGSMFDPLFGAWVSAVLGQGADVAGWISTAGAIGGLAGGVLLSRYGARLRPVLLLGLGNMLAGALLLALYNLTFLPAVLALALIKSLPLVASAAALDTLFQLSVADSHRGRVFGAVNTTNAVLGLCSLGIAGYLGERVGLVPMLSVAAALTLASGALALVLLQERASRVVPAEG